MRTIDAMQINYSSRMWGKVSEPSSQARKQKVKTLQAYGKQTQNSLSLQPKSYQHAGLKGFQRGAVFNSWVSEFQDI